MSAVAEHPATMDSSHVPNDGANLHYREPGSNRGQHASFGVPLVGRGTSGSELNLSSFNWGRSLVLQCLLDHRTGVTIQHRNRLLARVQIATDQSHLGLLQPERCQHGRRTVYADRFMTDVVMTSVFMRVNLRCAHQVRPPLGRMRRSAGQTSLVRAQDFHRVEP